MVNRILFLTGLLLTTALLFNACEISETRTNQGTIFVSAQDTSGAALDGARIWLDGIQTSSFTPDTLRQVPVGLHSVLISKPGFLPASVDVTVSDDDLALAALVAEDAPFAAIEMVDAPEGTTILIDNSQYAVTPPNLVDIGIGNWLASAYFPGYATTAPARWTLTLAPRDTARLPVDFTALAAGPNPGALAPVFELPSDLDSAIFRLQDYRGKIVLVSFFFYTCVPCLSEFPHIQEVYADPQYAGWLEFFGLDAIDPWSLFRLYRSVNSSLGLTFPLLHDRSQQTRTTLYEVASCPTNILIDPTGTIRYRFQSVSEGELRSAIESLIAEFEQPSN